MHAAIARGRLDESRAANPAVGHLPPRPGCPDAFLEEVGPSARRWALPAGPHALLIGRGPECDLMMPHAGISRRHIRLIRTPTGWNLEDLGSKNGTRVNDQPVQGTVPIRAGDRLALGATAFRLREPEIDGGASGRGPLPRLELLLEMSKLINSTLVLSEVLERVMDAVMHLTRAGRGFLLIDGPDGLADRVARGDTAPAPRISQSTVQRVFDTGEAFVSTDAGVDERLAAQASVVSLGLRTVMCVPMRNRGVVIGVIYVDSHNHTRGFGQEDLQTLEALADHAAVAIANARLVEENTEMFLSTIEALAEAIEKRDPYTGGHTQRVVDISLDLGGELGLSEEEQENLRMAALLHDIGKIGLDDELLRKQAPLDDGESALIRRHPRIGADIVRTIRKLKPVLPGILHHHEKVDGTGYPDGLKGPDIPLQARIVAVADSFDAMVSTRPYRHGRPMCEAVAELRRHAGSQFDPDVVEALVGVLGRKGQEYQKRYPSVSVEDSAAVS